MPYLIETYKPANGNLRLIDINKDALYSTKKDALEAIAALLIEQAEDNNKLLGWHAEALESQVMDLDTDDRILAQPHQYNYIYKAAKYGKRAIINMP